MKRLKSLILAFLVVCFVISFACFAWADSEVTFAWDANTEVDLQGYRLYRSDTSGGHVFGLSNCIVEIPAGTEIATDPNVPDGTWYWVVTAFDGSGNESGPSNEVFDTFDTKPPADPCLLRFF